MLRPPITAIAPSAMNSLLCMRWFTRSSRPPRQEARGLTCRAMMNGLNSRTSTLGWAAKARNISSPPGVEVVDQQPNANAAFGGVAQLAQQPATGFVDLSGSTARRASPRRDAPAAPGCRGKVPSGISRKPEWSGAAGSSTRCGRAWWWSRSESTHWRWLAGPPAAGWCRRGQPPDEQRKQQGAGQPDGPPSKPMAHVHPWSQSVQGTKALQGGLPAGATGSRYDRRAFTSRSR